MVLDELLHYCDVALRGMTGIVVELGDDLANSRPPLPGANSSFAILTHCLGVMEYWGGAVVAGRPIDRDRDAEFVATGSVADLAERVEVAWQRFRTDVADVPLDGRRRGEWDPDDDVPMREFTAGGVLLHVLEELCQHHGQLEITRDVLRSGRTVPP
jgi:hypothetical protein